MFELIIMLLLIIYNGFSNDGIVGIFANLNVLLMMLKKLLGLVNIFIVNITGDGILTNLFFHYVVYIIVGLVLELFNIKKGCFGKLFGKAAYWIIGIPVSFILNYFSTVIFD